MSTLTFVEDFSGADVDFITEPIGPDPDDILSGVLWVEDGTVDSVETDVGPVDLLILFHSDMAAVFFHTLTGSETEITGTGSAGSFPFIHGAVLRPDVALTDPVHDPAVSFHANTLTAEDGWRVFPFFVDGSGASPTIASGYDSAHVAGSSPSVRFGVVWRDEDVSEAGETPIIAVDDLYYGEGFADGAPAPSSPALGLHGALELQGLVLPVRMNMGPRTYPRPYRRRR